MNPNNITKMVIPAAGLGTRMIGAIPGIPGNFPKEMLPLGDRGAIQYAVAEGYFAGIRDFSIVIRQGKEIIRKLFEDGEYPGGLKEKAQAELDTLISECTFRFFEQEDLRGECDAIHQAREVLAGEPFVVVHPDNICLPHPHAVKQLCDAHAANPAHTLCLMEVNERNMECVSDSGRVDLETRDDRYRITGFHPKGEGFFLPRFDGELRACGIYVAEPDYLEYIARARELKDAREEITDGFVRRLMLDDGVDFYGVKVEGEVYDAGNPEGFWRTAGELARLLVQ